MIDRRVVEHIEHIAMQGQCDVQRGVSVKSA